MAFRLQGTLKDFSDPARRGQIADEVIIYLHRHEPFASVSRSDNDLRPFVLGSVITADALGIRKLSGFKRFAYLWLLTDGQVAQNADAMDSIRYGGADPDSQVEKMLQIAIRATAEVEQNRGDPR